ncbi:MAG TPA: hypothetical protein VKZ63_13355 [Kofleriaceae bacterium]|nr:hypothetical protein [Kofleriaceae bacterium]
MHHREELPGRSSLDGLWLVLVDQEGARSGATFEGRVPMMARAGDEQTYLLGFKNAQRVRKFLEAAPVPNAEPRLVVRGNKDEVLRVARANGVVGVLVDYDPQTRAYSAAAELF